MLAALKRMVAELLSAGAEHAADHVGVLREALDEPR